MTKNKSDIKKLTVLGIDYGTTNIGLALARNGIIAPLTTLTLNNEVYAIQAISRYCIENHVDELVVGLPLSHAGKETKMSKKVMQFGKKLRIYTKRHVTYQDEFGTSMDAHEETIRLGATVKERRTTDHIAAYFILKDFLEEA